jgi:endonuclease/exonuclease/phosphatase family metal-dependent hydrolase
MILLSFNIQYGFGSDGRLDLTRAAQVMESADIIALQEVDRHWQRSAMQDQPALLMDRLSDRFAVYGPGFDMDASTTRDSRVTNRRRQFGPMILSRWPILWSRLHLLPMRRMLDPINTQTAALEACIDAPGGALRVMSVHLAHVGVHERLAQIDHLMSLLADAQTSGPPWSGTDDEPQRNWTEDQSDPPNPDRVIVMGDFNCEPGSAEMIRLLGQTPYHPGARYAGGLVDAASHCGASLHTHEKTIAGVLRKRQLDHILVSPNLAPALRRVWSDPGQTASDHFPLWADIGL